MLGMIKNSLLSTVEAWPYRVLSKGEKVGGKAGRRSVCPRGRARRCGREQETSGSPSPALLPACPGCWQRLHPHLFPQEQLSYEERECEGGQFAAVEVVGKPFDEASKEGAVKLLKYVGGSNDKGERCSRPVSLAALCG